MMIKLCYFSNQEVSKFIFHNGPQKEAEATASVLIFCLETYLRLLAPIMPYVAEELYSNIPGTFSPITETSYPKTEEVCTNNIGNLRNS